jgi:hypothetical protein
LNSRSLRDDPAILILESIFFCRKENHIEDRVGGRSINWESATQSDAVDFIRCKHFLKGKNDIKNETMGM